MAAARWPARSEPANILPMASSRSFCPYRQEVEVHYCWHPLCGRRVKVRDIERRGGGRVVHIDAGDGEVRVIAGWMLDAAVCSALALGKPRVDVTALCNLHQLLINRHLRGNSPDDFNIVRKKRNAQATKRRPSRPAVIATDIAPAEHAVRPGRASGDEPLLSVQTLSGTSSRPC